MTGSRIFYRTNDDSVDSVVIEKDGEVVTTYRNAEELVETHIKGLLAKDQRAAKHIRELFSKARPNDAFSRNKQ